MNAFFKSIYAAFVELLSEDNAAPVAAPMTWAERKRAMDIAVDRGILRQHNVSVNKKLAIADKLRKQINESYVLRQEAMFAMVEVAIRSFVRVGS